MRILLIVLTLLIAAPAVHAQAKTGVVLLPIQGEGLSRADRDYYRGALVQALAGNDSSVLKSAVKGLFTQLAELKVSRSNEDEADAYGTRYLGYAGWDPYGIADFFSRMPSTGIEWLSTHPDPATRVQAVKDRVYQEAGGVNGHPAWNVGAKNVLVQNADEFRKQLAKMHN